MSKHPSADYEIVSPYTFLKFLPTIAVNKIPSDLGDYCMTAGFKAWNLLEEGVFFFFRQVFTLDTIKFGGNTLFKHEPEGIVLWDRCGTRNAFIYECKAKKDGYSISSDDLLRYKDYIRVKKHEIKIRHHLPLTHFLIVSSSFHGDLDSRLCEIDLEGVTLCLVKAELLKYLYEKSKELEYCELHLLDLPRLFCRGEISRENILSSIKKVRSEK